MASPKASPHPIPATHYTGAALAPAAPGNAFCNSTTPSASFSNGPKGPTQRKVGAVAEGHKESAVCGKDPYPAGGTAHCHLACPPPTGLADQHRDRRKRELPTEQRDTASPARCGDRQHLARMRHLGQEEDKVLDLAGAWWLAKGRGQSCALGCLQMTVLHLSGKVSSQPPLWP